MHSESETEMRVLSLRERLVADRDTYLRQLDRIGAGGAGKGIGLTVREKKGRIEDFLTRRGSSDADHARQSTGTTPRRSRA